MEEQLTIYVKREASEQLITVGNAIFLNLKKSKMRDKSKRENWCQPNIGMADQRINFLSNGNRKHINFDKPQSAMIEYLREYFDVDEKCRLLDIKLKDIEQYFLDKTKSHREYCLELLSETWYWRGHDLLFRKTQDEIEELDFRTASQLKQQLKKGKLTIKEMNEIIKFFVGSHDHISELYTKD